MIAFFLTLILGASNNELSASLKRLDQVLDNRQYYCALQEQKIDSLKQKLDTVYEIEARYAVYDRIEECYRKLSIDSCFVYIAYKRALALKMNNPNYICASDLNYAEAYTNSGQLLESETILSKYNDDDIPSYLRSYYYHIKRSLCEIQMEQTVIQEDKLRYLNKLQDLNIKTIEIFSEAYVVSTTYYINQNRLQEAENIILSKREDFPENNPNRSYYAYLYSKVFKARGDSYNQALQLSIAAINDLQQGIREHKALYELAFLLYEQGDIQRSYNYLRAAMEDASLCNARLRYIQSSTFFNIITQSYSELSDNRRKSIILTLVLVCVFTLILSILLYIITRRTIKLNHARKELKTAYKNLSRVNNDLIKTNKALEETDAIKEEYIGMYMDQCSDYIARFDSYRKQLRKMLVIGDTNGLEKELKTTGRVERELAEFYANFDSSFLHLFPNFVNEFNSLINEPIVPNSSNALTPELRIYALVRLGIEDSAKIAKFLRYSLSTIYNYRTKVRNKAKGERSEFEGKVKRISSF